MTRRIASDWRAVSPLLVVSLLGCSIPVSRVVGAESSKETLAEYATKHPGDPLQGEKVFAQDCATCHRVRGRGGEVGPDLSDVGGKLGRAELIESVVEPSKQIVEGYRPTAIATTDGRVFNGIVKAESADEVTLVDVNGRRQAIPKREIEERRTSNVSLMPDRLADHLSLSQFADLIAYLSSLRSSEQPSPGSGSRGPVRLPPGFVATFIADGITGATALEVAPDGRLFLCEQTGALRVVKGDRLLSEPFLSLKVDSAWERGLLGVALDPGFPDRSYVYLCTIAPDPYPHHRISRFEADGDRAKPGSEIILFEGDDQSQLGGAVPAGHQGGAIHFGKDGKLYIAIGEQTAGSPSQDLKSLLGKLLRINPDGSIPPGNPFVSRTEGKYRAIWALGLRNPFAFGVQPETGRIFIDDVGGVAEEINEGVAGANYGWPTVEHGPTTDRRFRGPIHSYPTASIVGGAFSPTSGTSLPGEYRGRYFFMDFVHGWIKVLDPDHPETASTFATGLARPVDLRFASDGSLYVLLRDAWVKDDHFRAKSGALLKVRYEGRP